MTDFVAKFAFWKGNNAEDNPVFEFFILKNSRDKKRAYLRALRAAQEDQKQILEISKEKTRT